MKKNLLVLFLFCFLQLMVNAQPGPPPPKNIQGLKIAFITRELTLSSEEAQKFWPIYYEYEGQVKKIRQEQKDDVLAFEEKVLVERKKFRVEMKKLLGTDERTNKALNIDREFNNVLCTELKQRNDFRNKRKNNNQ